MKRSSIAKAIGPPFTINNHKGDIKMKLYEVILATPNGVMESKGIYNAEEALEMNTKIKKELIIKYGSRVASHFKIHICEI